MKRIINILIIIILINSMAFALFNKDDVGTKGLQFLKIGIGARAIAMGSAYTSISDDVTSIYWNPSGLAGLVRQEASLMHYVWFENINYQSVLYAYPTGVGVFGCMINYLSVGDIERVDNAGNKLGSTFGASDMALTVSYAWNMTKKIALGANIKYLSSKLEDESATGVAIDLGGKMNIIDDKVSIGLNIQNIGPSVTYISEDTELPLTIRTGVSYRGKSVNKNNYIIGLDIYAPSDNELGVNLGGEYLLNIKDDISLAPRLGYQTYHSDLEGTVGITAGFGFGYKDMDIDYAWTPYGDDLGVTHQISLRLRFGKTRI